MTVTCVYIFPTENYGPSHFDLAARWVSSVMEYPPGYQCQYLIVSNGGPPSDEARMLMLPLDAEWLVHDDSGQDIGGYQAAVQFIKADLAVFFGGSSHVVRGGWLARMATAFEVHGPGIYGATANKGDANVNVRPHIRTTGFWMSPHLLRQYPVRISRNDQRYGFEHGKQCLTDWVKSQGHEAWMVTWSGEYLWEMWDAIPNGFHRGDQSDLIVRDRLTDPPFYVK